MTETYKKLLDNYKIVERVREDLINKTKEQVLKQYEKELKDIDNIWSKSSCDCLGHEHTCLRLKIGFIKNEK